MCLLALPNYPIAGFATVVEWTCGNLTVLCYEKAGRSALD
jgi:hypothetical protein